MIHFKYPRTYHLPFSEGIASDDKMITDLSSFHNKNVVITEKLDGENTSFYQDKMHARSLDSQHNFTRDWVKKLQSIINVDIPLGWRLCGENLSYFHSIHYENLESYFYLLSVWNEKNECLSWKETVEWAELLDLAQPQVFYIGIYDEDIIKKLIKDLNPEICEGFVLRLTDSFHYDTFSKNVIKYVRPNHVNNSSDFWLKRTYPNKLKEGVCKPYYMNRI